MRAFLIAIILSLLPATAHAQGFNPLQPTYWSGPTIRDYNRAGIYFYSPQPYYRDYAPLHSDGFYQRQQLNELRRLRYSIEDAQLQRRWQPRRRGW